MLSLLDLKRVVGHVGAPSANNYVVHLSVWETGTSIANNTSTVKYKMWITAENDTNVTEYDGTTKYMSGWSVDGAQLRATINLAGKQVAQTTAYYTLYWNRSWQNSAELIAEGSTTVTHNADGNLNMSITATLEQLNNYASNPSNGTISTSGWLDYIPRASTATLDKTTLTADGSSVKLTIAKATSSFTTTLTWKYGNSTGTLLNKSAATTATFTPNPADLYGQGLSGKVYFYLYTYNGNTQIGDTKTYSIDMTIPSVSTIKATDANIGSVSQLTITRNSTAYRHSLYYTFGTLDKWMNASGDTSTTEVKHDKTSVGFTIPSTFYAQIPNSKTGKAKVYVITYYGNSKVGATQSAEFTVTAANSEPTITNITTIDQNSTTVALTGNSGIQVRYFSNTKFGFTATARNSATIASTAIALVDTGATSTPSRIINGYDNTGASLRVTDSRGYTTSTIATPYTLNYVKLTTNHRVYRPQPTDGSARIVYSGDYWNGNFGAVHNTLTLLYRWKPKGGNYSSWVGVTPTISGNKYTATVNLSGFDYKTDYQFQISVYDKLMTFEPADETTLLRAGKTVFNWGKKDFSFEVPVNGGNSILTVDGGDASLNEVAQMQIKGTLPTSTQASLAVTRSDDKSLFLMYGSSGRSGLWINPTGINNHWIIAESADHKYIDIEKPLRLDGHASEIGAEHWAAKTVSNLYTNKIVGLTLERGVWSISYSAKCGATSGQIIQMTLYPADTANWSHEYMASCVTSSGGSICVTKTINRAINNPTETWNLFVYTSTTLSVDVVVHAARIA